MIQDKLNSLRPYVTGLRFVNQKLGGLDRTFDKRPVLLSKSNSSTYPEYGTVFTNKLPSGENFIWPERFVIPGELGMKSKG